MALAQPSNLAPKQPPYIRLAMLRSRDEADTISIRESGCFVEPPLDQPRDAPDAKKLARANAIRHGYVQEDLRSTIVGKLSNKSLIDKWDKGGGYKRICVDIMNEMYGPQSPLRLWADGEATEEKVDVKITNWTLDLAALEKFPPAEETTEAKATREAKIVSLKQAISTLQADVKRMYKQAFISASRSAATNAYAMRQKELWQPLVEHDVQSIFSPEHFGSISELRSAELLPYAKRALADRLSFWRDRITPDVIASHIHRSSAVVDIKTMLEDPDYQELFAQRLPIILDYFNRYLFYQRDVLTRLKSIDNATVRHNAYVPDETKKVYQQIRNVDIDYTAYLLETDCVIDWKDLPAFNDRPHTQMNDGPGEPNTDNFVADDENAAMVSGEKKQTTRRAGS